MKQIIYPMVPLFLSILVCFVFMDISKEESVPVMSEILSPKIFKTGAYEEVDLAEKEASLKKGIVLMKDNKYEVVIGILKHNSNIERLISYLDEKGIYYYIEDAEISAGFNDILNKYEDLMITSTSSVAFLQLNKKILERYKILYES